MAPNLTPIAAVCRNPLQGIRPEDRYAVRIGTRIRDLKPESTGGLLVCRFNEEWLLREHWDELVQAGDRIEWYEYPQGRETIRTLLTVALLVATIAFTQGALTSTALAYVGIANAAYNLLVPPRAPSVPQQTPAGSVFATSLAGNAARLDQPIWRNCGRVKITPPFAAQPYTEFKASDPVNPTVDTDQFYYAVFALGIGDYDIEKAFIGKTPISHFQDVLIAQYLAPGVQPSTALANVVSSDEVSASLEMPEGVYVGGYTASRPGDTVLRIGIDVAASQGLGIGTDPLTVEWQVEMREVDQYGRPTGTAEWQVIGAESRTAATNTPQRWSNTYTLSAAIRPEVRVGRTNIKNTDPNARDGIQWIGMRAYLEKEAALNPDTAHYEVVMRASEQLSSFSQRDFSMIVRGKVRTWSPGGGWGAPVFTRNAMWWLADLWTNPVWGEGLSDSRVDLQTLYDIAQELDTRQDRFDYSFTTARDSWEAAQLVAHSARCRAFRRGGVYSLARDELVDVPVMAITGRNTEPKSMVVHASLPQREQPDGIVVEYQSNVTWDTATEECPCPGFSASDPESPFYDAGLPVMANPVYIGLDGITGRFHALREGIYQAASMAYRTSTVSAKVELEGIVVAFMDPILWQPQIRGYGQTGDVAFWDDTTLVMGLTEPPDFSAPPYLTLQRDDGTLTDPVAVLPGPTMWDVTLPALPDFGITTNNAFRERTKFVLGPLATSDELVKLTKIDDGGNADGAQLFDLQGLIDDDRVHEADNDLLPGPGEIQDPIDDGTDYADDEGPGSVAVARLTDHFYNYTGWRSGGPTYHWNFTFTDTGAFTFQSVRDSDSAVIESGSYSHEWLAFPVEPDQVDDFEVYVLDTGSTTGIAFSGASLNTWLPMSSSYTWTVASASMVGDVGAANIQFRVRRIGGTIVQATSSISIGFGEVVSGGG